MTQSTFERKPATSDHPRLMKLVQSTYNAQQQVHYLYLQAEIDSLLLKQKALKEQRLSEVPTFITNN